MKPVITMQPELVIWEHVCHQIWKQPVCVHLWIHTPDAREYVSWFVELQEATFLDKLGDEGEIIEE